MSIKTGSDQAKVKIIATDIAKKYAGQTVVLLQVLEGGAHMSNLLAATFRELGVGYERTSLSTASYYNGTTAAKEVTLIPVGKIPLQGRIVVVGEDIMDTAGTYVKICDYLQSQSPAAIEFVVGINKPHKRSPENQNRNPSYAVLTTNDNGFCGGGGMDFKGFFRDEKSVRTADPELFNPTPPLSPKRTVG